MEVVWRLYVVTQVRVVEVGGGSLTGHGICNRRDFERDADLDLPSSGLEAQQTSQDCLLTRGGVTVLTLRRETRVVIGHVDKHQRVQLVRLHFWSQQGHTGHSARYRNGRSHQRFATKKNIGNQSRHQIALVKIAPFERGASIATPHSTALRNTKSEKRFRFRP